MGEVGLGEVRDLLDLEDAVLGDGLDQEGTGTRLLNSHVDAAREAGLKVPIQVFVQFAVGGRDAVLRVGANTAGLAALVNGVGGTLVVHLVRKSRVIPLLLLGQVLEVGNGEGDTDAEQKWIRMELIPPYGLDLLFIAELSGENDFLFPGDVLDLETLSGHRSLERRSTATHLPRTILEHVLDILDGALEVTKAGSLLMPQLILEFGDQLRITCGENIIVSKNLSYGAKAKKVHEGSEEKFSSSSMAMLTFAGRLSQDSGGGEGRIRWSGSLLPRGLQKARSLDRRQRSKHGGPGRESARAGERAGHGAGECTDRQHLGWRAELRNSGEKGM